MLNLKDDTRTLLAVCTSFLFLYNATDAYLCVCVFLLFCIYVSSLYVLWVASIVDLRVFWQPGSVLFVLNCRDYSLFESNKFLLLLLLLLLLCAPAIGDHDRLIEDDVVAPLNSAT